jgi:membrane protease YdiL (CAAX protease family)
MRLAIMKDKDALHSVVAWSAVGALLFLRIPFSIFITYAYPSDEQLGPAIFQAGTYLLTAFLIWWERDSLSAVNMDGIALALFLLLKPLQTLILSHWGIEIPLAFPHPVGLLIWAIATGLLIALWRSGYRPGVPGVSTWIWLGFGLLAGIALSILPNLGVFQANAGLGGAQAAPSSSVTVSAGLAFLYQLGFAAVSEEPLFRGFLWGYLRRLGWRQVWVWLLQAGLFMIAHLYFINALAFNFWVIVPVAGLVFGWFAWRSRSIAPGMLAHAAYNAGVYVIFLGLFSR